MHLHAAGAGECRAWGGITPGLRKAPDADLQGDNSGVFLVLPLCRVAPQTHLWPLSAAQVPDSDEQFVPDFHSENCE